MAGVAKRTILVEGIGKNNVSPDNCQLHRYKYVTKTTKQPSSPSNRTSDLRHKQYIHRRGMQISIVYTCVLYSSYSNEHLSNLNASHLAFLLALLRFSLFAFFLICVFTFAFLFFSFISSAFVVICSLPFCFINCAHSFNVLASFLAFSLKRYCAFC